jgi:hypothetical protein
MIETAHNMQAGQMKKESRHRKRLKMIGNGGSKMSIVRTSLISFMLGGVPVLVAPTPVLKNQVVEASCGTCQFGMKGDTCALAIRQPEGKTYWVSGFSIDQFGDAHAANGFCQAIRKATVSGTLVGDQLIAKTFVLIKEVQ